MRRLLALALVLSVPLTASDQVVIDLRPLVVMEGGTVRINCRVPRHPDNRKLEYGLENYSYSERPLEGEHSQVFWGPFYYERVPCTVGQAFCRVTRTLGRSYVDTSTLHVGGC